MVLWFGHEMVLTDKIPFFRDLGPYFYPLRWTLAESLKSGDLPLWSRHMAMGFPAMADFQLGVFYPPHVIYLLPFSAAVRVCYLLHYFIAAFGAYFLCRHWKYPPYLALLGAVFFCFGGTIVSLTNLLNHFQTAVWLPWVVLLWERFLDFSSIRRFTLFTLALLVQFLAGSPEFYLMSAGLLALDSFARRQARCFPLARLGALAGANALVLLLAMAQVLPTAELFYQSRWAEPMAYGENPSWSLHPLSLLNLIYLDKVVHKETMLGISLLYLRDLPLFVSHYVGMVAFCGLLFWLVASSWVEKSVLVATVVFSSLLALGGHTPVYPFAYRYLPFFSFFRFPEKFFFIANATILYAALKGLYAHFSAAQDRRRLNSSLLVLVAPLALYFFLRHDTSRLSEFIAHHTPFPLFSTDTLERTATILVHLERQLLLAGGLLGLFFLCRRLRPAFFQCLLVGAAFVDLNSAHQAFQFLLSPSFIENGGRILAAPDAPPSRLFFYPAHSYLHPHIYVIDGNPSFAKLNEAVFANLLPNTGVFYGFDYLQEIDALRRWPYVAFLGVANKLPPDQLYRLLGRMNVKYVSSFQPLANEGIVLRRHFPEYPSWLYELKDVLPRAYVVFDAVAEKNPRAVIERLASAEFDPTKAAILENKMDRPIGGKDCRGKAAIVRYKNEYVAVDASLTCPGILVLADSYYPGWRVFTNGREGQVERVNLFFRGVLLPPGSHAIEFRFRPDSFVVGSAISIGSWCALGLFLIAALRKPKC